jgi:hypothetical protein
VTSFKKEIRFADAHAVVIKVLAALVALCEYQHLDIGGSYGRFQDAKRHGIDIPDDAVVHDLDVAYIPLPGADIEGAINAIGVYVGRHTWEVDGIPVDLMEGKPGAWGAIYEHCMGDGPHNIKMRAKAKYKGLVLSQYGLFRDGKMVAGENPESIWNVLNLGWKPPHRRGPLPVEVCHAE